MVVPFSRDDPREKDATARGRWLAASALSQQRENRNATESSGLHKPRQSSSEGKQVRDFGRAG
jgi:hypothetical protein